MIQLAKDKSNPNVTDLDDLITSLSITFLKLFQISNTVLKMHHLTGHQLLRIISEHSGFNNEKQCFIISAVFLDISQ